MTILVGQHEGTNITILQLTNGVQVSFECKIDSSPVRFYAEYAQGHDHNCATDITAEITSINRDKVFATSADQLLHWLSLAKDWKPAHDKSCEQRIGEHLESHLADMRKLHNLQRIDEDEWEGDANLRLRLWSDNWGNMPGNDHDSYLHQDAVEIAEDCERESFAISVQKKTVYDIQCSWGGPSDGFLVEVDEDEIVGIIYYFKDWFDGARQVLSGDAFDTAQGYIGQMVYLGD